MGQGFYDHEWVGFVRIVGGQDQDIVIIEELLLTVIFDETNVFNIPR